MKTITAAFIFLLFSSCAPNKFGTEEITFSIVNSYVLDNTEISLIIRNTSTTNYYLPIINSQESEKWKFMLSANENQFFFLYPLVYSFDNSQISWSTEDCFAEGNIDIQMTRLRKLWQQKKNSIAASDLILIRAGESVEITIPFNSTVKLTDDCTWHLQSNNSKNLNLILSYGAKDRSWPTTFLSPKTLDELNSAGYKLYSKRIKSNLVPIRY